MNNTTAKRLKNEAEMGVLICIGMLTVATAVLYYLISVFTNWEKNPLKVLPACAGWSAGTCVGRRPFVESLLATLAVAG